MDLEVLIAQKQRDWSARHSFWYTAFNSAARELSHGTGFRLRTEPRRDTDDRFVIGRLCLNDRILPMVLVESEVPVTDLKMRTTTRYAFAICWDFPDSGNPEDPPDDDRPLSEHYQIMDAVIAMAVQALYFWREAN